MNDVDEEFLILVEQFLESSRDLRNAAELCEEDPVKQDMVAGVVEDFHSMWSRSEALQLLIQKDYGNCREYILQEIREITFLNQQMTKQIREKLIPLTWN